VERGESPLTFAILSFSSFCVQRPPAGELPRLILSYSQRLSPPPCEMPVQQVDFLHLKLIMGDLTVYRPHYRVDFPADGYLARQNRRVACAAQKELTASLITVCSSDSDQTSRQFSAWRQSDSPASRSHGLRRDSSVRPRSCLPSLESFPLAPPPL
jgi:hypothetical protein